MDIPFHPTPFRKIVTEIAAQRNSAPILHPAPFSVSLLSVIERILVAEIELPFGSTILDPFGGIGRIHLLSGRYRTISVEIEPEWVAEDTIMAIHCVGRSDLRRLYGYDPSLSAPSQSFCGDSGELCGLHSPLYDVVNEDGERLSYLSVDAIVVSPCYGSRMADHHNAQDASKRRTYRHTLGRMPTEGSASVMQWGEEYRDLHAKVWLNSWAWLRKGGYFILNSKDHVRKGEVQPVTAWHSSFLTKGLGMRLVSQALVETPHYRFGANREARCPEQVLVFQKGDA